MSSNRRVNTENDLSVRFADNLPKHDSLHSSPTIAKSRLTASVSINDLSKSSKTVGNTENRQLIANTKNRFPSFRRLSTSIPTS
jgi:hypothetical protein